MPADATRAVTRRTVLSSLGQPKVAVMLMLGFSSGLPFFLTGNTLGYWLRDQGTTLQAIGFLSCGRRSSIDLTRPSSRGSDGGAAGCSSPSR